MPRCLHLLGLAALLLSLPALATPPLRILSWPGYADEDLVAAFEQRYQHPVEVTLVHSDEQLRRQFNRQQGRYFDLIAANTAELQALHAQQRLLALPLQQLPNRLRQQRRFRDLQTLPAISADGQVYAIPYAYAEMGLIYDRQQLSQAPQSIASLWDPALHGRVLIYDGGSHNFALAALRQGLPPFDLPAQALNELARDLQALRRNSLTFYRGPEESAELFISQGAALMFANYGQQQVKLLRDAGADIGYSIPREGALAWLDCWAINQASQQVELALRWIDYSLEPPVSQALSERHGLGSTLEGAADALPAQARLHWLQPVENEQRRSQLWQAIRSGKRQLPGE